MWFTDDSEHTCEEKLPIVAFLIGLRGIEMPVCGFMGLPLIKPI